MQLLNTILSCKVTGYQKMLLIERSTCLCLGNVLRPKYILLKRRRLVSTHTTLCQQQLKREVELVWGKAVLIMCHNKYIQTETNRK